MVPGKGGPLLEPAEVAEVPALVQRLADAGRLQEELNAAEAAVKAHAPQVRVWAVKQRAGLGTNLSRSPIITLVPLFLVQRRCVYVCVWAGGYSCRCIASGGITSCVTVRVGLWAHTLGWGR